MKYECIVIPFKDFEKSIVVKYINNRKLLTEKQILLERLKGNILLVPDEPVKV